MVPAHDALWRRPPAEPTPRFGFVYVPHGSIMREWTPAQDGADFEFSPILKPLETVPRSKSPCCQHLLELRREPDTR